MSKKVECYSGSVYPERPLALHWQGQRLRVEEILQAWQTPQGRHFQVRTADLQVFELIYQAAEDDWHISQITGP